MSLNPSFDEIKRRVDLRELCYTLGMERRGAGSWVCPCCGSGTGPNRSAAFGVKGDAWHCFSCGEGGDCFDLVGVTCDIGDKLEQRAVVCKLAGIPILDERAHEIDPNGFSRNAMGSGAREPRKPPTARMRAESGEIARFKQEQERYIGECQRALAGSEGEKYMASRGVDLETCAAWGVGWDAASRRVVMPYSKSSWAWVARTVDDGAGPKYVKPKLPDGVKMPTYANEPAIESGCEFWVVEGWLDMLAVEQCGRRAVALVGTGNGDAAAALDGFDGLAFVALDSDAPGQEAAARLAGQLRDAGVECAVAGPWPEGAKDPGELMEGGDLEALAAHLGRVEDVARAEAAAELAEACERRLRKLGVSGAPERLRLVREGRDLPEHTPTGLPAVDDALCGGLPAGLTILGATSSTGKTTLCVQVAEHVAIGGKPVLYVTVEQSALELAAKQAARAMYERQGARVGTREILSAAERAEWCEAQKNALGAACEELEREFADERLRYMTPPAGQPSVAEVREAASLMADIYGSAPLVIVDYLQLLAPANERQTEKQAVDCNVMALRQLARDLQTPVLVVSSLNRASYCGEVSMDAFKESGAIEYAADVLLGLQPAGIGHEEDARRAMVEHKSKAVRECELAVLKNRNGALPAEPVPLTFDAVACTFECGERESVRHRRR